MDFIYANAWIQFIPNNSICKGTKFALVYVELLV